MRQVIRDDHIIVTSIDPENQTWTSQRVLVERRRISVITLFPILVFLIALAYVAVTVFSFPLGVLAVVAVLLAIIALPWS